MILLDGLGGIGIHFAPAETPLKNSQDHPMRRPGILRHSSLLDVAARAGVSRAMASRAFNNYPHVRADLRRRVLKAIKPIERPWIS